MAVPVYIGDEVSACGYRLAGLEVFIPDREDLAAAISAACEDAPLVLLNAAIAEALPDGQLATLLARVTPPVVVVPDVRGLARPPDLATRLRRQLGVLE
jgi:vacuolar-type H+-ATPase subunit F/Vma7